MPGAGGGGTIGRGMDGGSVRRARWLLALALVAHVGLATTSLLQTPAFEGPDENDHCYYADLLVRTGRLPLIRGSARRLGRPDYEEVATGHHPPLYYLLLAATLEVVADGDCSPVWRSNPGFPRDPRTGRFHKIHGADERAPVSSEIGVLRVLRAWSVLFGALGLMVTYGLGRVLWPSRPMLAGGAALAQACVPQWAWLHGLVDNGNLAALLGDFGLLVVVAGLRRERLTAARGRALGLVAGAALLAKATALFLPVAAACAYVVAWRRARGRRRELVRSALWAAAVALLVAGWFYARNLALYGDVLGAGAHEAAFKGNRVADGDRWRYLLAEFPVRAFETAVAGVGWTLERAPSWTEWLAFALLATGAIGWVRRRRELAAECGAGAVMVLVLAIAAVMAVLVRYNVTYYQPQGRYLLPAYGPVILLAAAGIGALAGPVARRARALALAAPWAGLGLGSWVLGTLLESTFGTPIDWPRALPPAEAGLWRFHASMVRGLATEPPPARRRIELVAPADGAAWTEPPTLTWRDPERRPQDRYTVHLVLPSGHVFGTFEFGWLDLSGPSWRMPASSWRALPAGVPIRWKVRRLPDRTLGEEVVDVPESGFRRVVRAR